MRTALMALAIMMALVTAVTAAEPAAPILPDPQKAIHDPAMEKLAGLLFSQEFEEKGFNGKKPVILPPDAPETRLVRSITDRLAAAIKPDRPSLRFQVKVVKGPDVNAFCIPGGYVYVYTGLLDFIKGQHQGKLDEDELAGVLGHEMAHAVLRHQLITWGNSKDYRKVIEQPGLLKAVLLASDRQLEFEADRYGALYMLRAGFQLSRLIRLFENMARRDGKTPEHDEDVSDSDHPSPWQRARHLREYLRQLRGVLALWDEATRSIGAGNLDDARSALEILASEFPSSPSVHNNLGWVSYQIYQRSLSDESRGEQQVSYAYVPSLGINLRGGDAFDRDALESARQSFEDALRLNPDLVNALEGAALCALAAGDQDAAKSLLEKAAKLGERNPSVQNHLGVLNERQGRKDEAAMHYRKALESNPNHAPSLFNLSGLEQRGGQPEKAKALLQRYLALDPAGYWADRARKRLTLVGGTAAPAPPLTKAPPLETLPGVKLGLSRDEVLAVLGTPADREALQSGTEVLRYPDRGLELWLGAAGVRMIVLSSPQAGKVANAFVGMPRSAVESVLGEAAQVTKSEDGLEYWSYASRGISVGLRDAKVDVIVISTAR